MEELITNLEKVRFKLEKQGTDLPGELHPIRNRFKESGLERTYGLLSYMGKDCPYYKKSLSLFLKQDLEEIQNMLKEANLEL